MGLEAFDNLNQVSEKQDTCRSLWKFLKGLQHILEGSQ